MAPPDPQRSPRERIADADLDSPAVGISRRRILVGLALVIAFLLALHATSQIARFQFERPTLAGISERVYFGAEASLPAWFTSSLMLGCALLLLVTGAETRRRRRPDAWYWLVLGMIFIVLSADEAAALHETLSPVFGGGMRWLAASVGGVFVPLSLKPGYAWVIPGALLTAAVGVAFLRFLWRLPARTRWMFVVSAAVFLAGAVGVEVIGGAYSGQYGADDVTFVLIMTLEETLEMAGMTLFAYALLSHIAAEFGTLRLRPVN